MRKLLAVLIVTFALVGFAHAADDIEQLKADYQLVVNQFADNANSQRLIVEGFKATNSTFQALVTAQQKLQTQARDLADKIKKLETPPAPDAPVGE